MSTACDFSSGSDRRSDAIIRPFAGYWASQTVVTPRGNVEVCGAVVPETLSSLTLDPTLCRFRPPARQLAALIEIAALPAGGVFVARHGDVVVGYCTFHPPDPGTRWGDAGLPFLLEMGAIEVSPEWRSNGLGQSLLKLGFANPGLDDFVVLSTEYWWHWDLSGADMELWDYRNMLVDIMRSVGLIERKTDDSDIASHPVNMLTVRVGERISRQSADAFDALCHLRSGGAGAHRS